MIKLTLKSFTRIEENLSQNHSKDFYDTYGYKVWKIFCGDILVARIVKQKNKDKEGFYYYIIFAYGLSVFGAFNKGTHTENFAKTYPPAMRKRGNIKVIPNIFEKKYQNFADAKTAVKQAVALSINQFLE